MHEMATGGERPRNAKEQLILDAAVQVLARDGIAGLTIRAVSAEAGVALGLTNYYFDDKVSLIAAALRTVDDDDAELVASDDGLNPTEQLTGALRRAADDRYLQNDYLRLRLQLWSLAASDPRYANINHEAQARYLDGLARLIAAARPDLEPTETLDRAFDILVIQNGIWLTALLIRDEGAIERGVRRTIDIAFS